MIFATNHHLFDIYASKVILFFQTAALSAKNILR